MPDIIIIMNDPQSTTRLCNVTGTGGHMWYIDINGYHNGRIWSTENFGWRYDTPPNTKLTIDDIDIFIDMIEKRMNMEKPHH